MKPYDKLLRAMADHIEETGTFKGDKVYDVRLNEDPSAAGEPNIEVELVSGQLDGVWLFIVTTAHERSMWEEAMADTETAPTRPINIKMFDRYFGPVFEIETLEDYCAFLYPQKYAVKFKLLRGLEPWDQIDAVGIPDQMINKMARSLERPCARILYRG